jgi:hypothetical protein
MNISKSEWTVSTSFRVRFLKRTWYSRQLNCIQSPRMQRSIQIQLTSSKFLQQLYHPHTSELQVPISPRTSRHSTDDNPSCGLVRSWGTCCSARTMAYNKIVDDLRDIEYPMMKGRQYIKLWTAKVNRACRTGKKYLDHTGTTIYSKSLIEEFSRKMMTNLYGFMEKNSFKFGPSTTVRPCGGFNTRKGSGFFQSRSWTLDHVFVVNATAAIKIVGECFWDLVSASPNSSTFWCGYHKDAHASVFGVREMTKWNHHCFTSDDQVENWLNNFQATSIALNSSTTPTLLFP